VKITILQKTADVRGAARERISVAFGENIDMKVLEDQ